MTESAKQKIIIVDENDEVVGSKERGTLAKKDIYRVSALWLTNSRGEILLAKRHRNKTHHPEKWCPAVTGTVEEGETYLENMLKEAEEELGLKNINPELGPKTKIDSDYVHFTQWYTLSIDKNISEFTIQKNEVEEIAWLLPEELEKQLKEQPEKFGPNMRRYFGLFLTRKKSACILLENSEKKILLMLRDNNPAIPYPNQWYTLGGGVEENETFEEAIVREMREELELDLKDFEFFRVFEWPEKTETVFHKKIDLDIEKIKLHEGQKLAYFSRDEIASMNLAFHDNKIVEEFFSR